MLPLSDPETRIITSDDSKENPQLNIENYLEKLKLIMKNPATKEEYELTLEFSPSYNGIIGSRGSGKSLLGSILANQNVDKYSEYVDHTRTLYKIKGKKYQNNPPKCKYLSQSSLLDIYNNGDVRDIDFIKEYCSAMEQESKLKTSEYIGKMNKLLNIEKEIFMAIIDAGDNVLNDISFIESSVNEEYMIPTFESTHFNNGKKIIEDFNNRNLEVEKALNNLVIDLNKIDIPDEKYSELIELGNLIDEFKNGLVKHIDNSLQFIRSFEEKVSGLDIDVINLRGIFIEKLLKMIELENISSDITAKNFLDDKEKAVNQLKGLTKFRAMSQMLFEYGRTLTNDVKIETKSKDITVNDSNKLVISTTLEDTSDFKDYISEHLKINGSINHNDLMLNLIFSYNEIEKFSNHFNGTKYRRSSLSSPKQYIDRLYTNLTACFGGVGTFSIRLYFNDKELDKYSPGKKSEILLDIFLDKSILGENYTYIILDQPEDNMDTKTITKKLIKKIRELKKHIQLLVISHSAAVIINGDSENLIYAKEIDNSLSYDYGRIIDDAMKKNIVDTLDGGEKNLKMRLNKYDFRLEESWHD